MCIDDKYSKPVFLYRGKNAFNKFITAVLNEFRYEYRYCGLMIKKNLSWL